MALHQQGPAVGFFSLAWETQTLSTSPCRPMHCCQRPKSLLTHIWQCRVQTARNLQMECLGSLFNLWMDNCEIFFLLYYPFELQMLYLILDLLNSISFNHETFWRKQKQNLKVTWTVVGSLHCLDGSKISQIVYSREPFGNQPCTRNKRIINSGKWTEFGLLSFLYMNHTPGPP